MLNQLLPSLSGLESIQPPGRALIQQGWAGVEGQRGCRPKFDSVWSKTNDNGVTYPTAEDQPATLSVWEGKKGSFMST